MSTSSEVTRSARLTRGAAVVATMTAVLTVSVTVGAARERAALPTAGQALLQATIAASDVSGCLQGARDELYLPGQPPQLHNPIAVQAALGRLRVCDIDELARSVSAVKLPPAAAVTDSARRRARDDIANGVALLQRVVLDARAAKSALTRQVGGAADGTAVALAYRSADSGGTAAYALAEEALALLGHPQSSIAG